MDVDLQGVRAFVATAEELHFGRAAARLFLTQQALSKRIRRLEQALTVPLFARTTRSVQLTAAGQRFLPLAREALAAFDTAVEAVRESAGRLRVDVYDERFTPMRILRQVAETGLQIEPSMRQGLTLALPAVRSREIDAAFGHVRDVPGPWPPELAQRLVHLEPIHAYVGTDHPLAARDEMRPAELRSAGISMPDPGGAAETRGFLTRLTRHFGIPLRFTEPAVGLRHYGEQVRREHQAVALGEASIELLPDSGLHRIRLTDPVPLFPWSIVWHHHDTSPQLRRLLELLPTPVMPTDESYWLPGDYLEGA